MQQKKWEDFLINHGITEGEICASQPSGSPGQRWYIRLGPKQTGYHKSAVLQVNSGLVDEKHLAPPRIGNIATLRRTLRMKMKGVYENPAESESDSDIGVQPDIEPEAEDPIQTNEGNNTINNKQSNANELALNIEMDPAYSCLINAIHQLPDTQIKQLIGDLVRIQRSRCYIA